jgi:hypothetical protein
MLLLIYQHLLLTSISTFPYTSEEYILIIITNDMSDWNYNEDEVINRFDNSPCI